MIKAFQENQDKTILNRILEFVEIDFLKDPTREGEYETVRIHLDRPEKYIAYRIRAFREKIARHARSIRAGHINEWYELLDYVEEYKNKGIIPDDTPFKIPEIEKYIGDIKKMHLDNLIDLYKDWYDEPLNTIIKKAEKDIERDIEYVCFMSVYNLFADLDKQIEEKKKEIRARLQQYIVPALEYALSKANLGHTDKEIVTYINRAWLSKFIELQLKDSGMKRIQRRKDGIYFSKVVSPIMRDVMSMLFGDSLKVIKDIAL